MARPHTRTRGGEAHDGAIAFGAGAWLLSGAGVPVDGTSGTGVSLRAGKGSIYSDKTNGKLYVNGGTATSPVWKLVTSAA